MKFRILLFFLFFCFSLSAQNTPTDSILSRLINLNQVAQANEDFSSFEPLKELLKDVDVIMLGEQSHGEAVAFETKIKLVKYLHEEMGFDILAFESDFYSCHKAWEMIEQGEEVEIALGKSVTFLWSMVKEFKPLVKYIERRLETDRPLKITGFDGQLYSRYSEKELLGDLKEYLEAHQFQDLEGGRMKHLEESMGFVNTFKFKKYKKKEVEKDIRFINEMMNFVVNEVDDDQSSFWTQTLKSFKIYLSDLKLKTDDRDEQMADNLYWLKENNPGKKIICWGATSHFLYNSDEVRMKSWAIQVLAANYYKKHKMMGEYVKEKFGDKLFTIGFVAHEGKYGTTRQKKLKKPKGKSLEYLLGQSEYDNCLLPLKGLQLNDYLSRPLGNFYMKNDISNLMDAVIFNRKERAPDLDNNLFLKIYPENKYIKPDLSE